MKWAIALEKEVRDLKTRIAPQLAAINLLLQFELMEHGAEMQDSMDQGLHAVRQLHVNANELKTQLKELANRQQLDGLADLVRDFNFANEAFQSDILPNINLLQKSVDAIKFDLGTMQKGANCWSSVNADTTLESGRAPHSFLDRTPRVPQRSFAAQVPDFRAALHLGQFLEGLRRILHQALNVYVVLAVGHAFDVLVRIA